MQTSFKESEPSALAQLCMLVFTQECLDVMQDLVKMSSKIGLKLDFFKRQTGTVYAMVMAKYRK